jgi:hypothetical protein
MRYRINGWFYGDWLRGVQSLRSEISCGTYIIELWAFFSLLLHSLLFRVLFCIICIIRSSPTHHDFYVLKHHESMNEIQDKGVFRPCYANAGVARFYIQRKDMIIDIFDSPFFHICLFIPCFKTFGISSYWNIPAKHPLTNLFWWEFPPTYIPPNVRSSMLPKPLLSAAGCLRYFQGWFAFYVSYPLRPFSSLLVVSYPP